MDSSNIKTILKDVKWGPTFTIIKACLILYMMYKLLKLMKGYIENLGILQTSTVPGLNLRFTYPKLVISHYKKATPECPALCSFFETVSGFCRAYGKAGLFGSHLIFKPFAIFYKAEAVEALLNNPACTDKSREYEFLKPWLGTGLITSQRAKWRRNRRLLTPTFYFSILEDCIPVFQEQANILISKIKSRVQEPWIDIEYLLSLCSLDIICETAMGVSMNIQNGEHCEYSEVIHGIENIVMYRILRPWLYNDTIFNLTAIGRKFNSNIRLVNEFTYKILKQKMDIMTKKKFQSTFDNTSNKYLLEKKMRKPFLELLLEHHLKDPSFTENDVRDEVNTFMSAGHDTTAKAVSWALYLLGLNPESQNKVHEELDELFTNEENENISRDSLTKMKYLECVVKETLRLYPVAPIFARDNSEPFKVANYTVKKDTFCVVFVYELHRDPVAFPDPERFIPERFFPKNSAGRHPFAYIPFSAGPRNCIGQKFGMMETLTILACILRHFRVKSLDPRDKVLVYPNITLANSHPLRVRFECR